MSTQVRTGVNVGKIKNIEVHLFEKFEEGGEGNGTGNFNCSHRCMV